MVHVMICPLEFAEMLRLMPETQPEQKRLLTRVLLNTVYDSAAYPFDLSELLQLETEQRCLGLGFITAAANYPGIRSWDDGFLTPHIDYLDSGATPDA